MNWRHAALLGALLLCTAVAFIGPPIAQPLEYHRFADARKMLGVPNALNVLSNLPFALVGIAGLGVLFGRRPPPVAAPAERSAYAVLFAGVAMTAAGSSYYHLAPDNARLVWDRLPMAIGFMGLLDAILAERVSIAAAQALLVPLVLLGCASVLYWSWTETSGAGDLRLYLLVQFGSLVIVVLMLGLFRARFSGSGYLILGLAGYALAKVLELLDAQIFARGGVVSGHTLKHLSAAAGVACVAAMLGRREVVR